MGVLFFIVFIDLVGFGVVIPLLPYYALDFHASPLAVTSMMSCYSLGQFFSSPLLGRLSDRIGRKPVILASLVCSIASYVWLGFASALWMLFAARLLAGAGAGNIAAAQAYVTDVTPPEGRAKGMGMIGAALGLGFTVGPALGGLAAGGGAHLEYPAFLAAALSAAKSAWRRPRLRLLILMVFVAICAFAGMETTFALWAHEGFGWGPMQIGWIFFYVCVLLVAIQGGLIGRLTKLFGEEKLFIAGAATIAAGLIAVPFATALWGVLAAFALVPLGQ